jgi:hypothetical protein
MASISKVALRPREPIGFRRRASLVPLSDRAVMVIERLVGATILAIFTSSVAASAEPPSADKMVAAFQSICAGGKTGQTAELGRADVLGWGTSGAGAPVRFDPSTQRLSPSSGPVLVLTTMSGSAGGVERESCAISSLTPVQGVAEAVRNSLGFAPFFAARGSATFSAVKIGEDWKPASALDQAATAAARRQGRFYSIMVLNNGATQPDGSNGYAVSVTFYRATPKG